MNSPAVQTFSPPSRTGESAKADFVCTARHFNGGSTRGASAMTSPIATPDRSTGPPLKTEPLPHRRFGKTGERVPVVGLGTGPGGMGLTDDEAVALYHAAIDRGVNYIDTAPGYERAHVQLGRVLPERRDEVFLVTKCWGA